jgi:hypothetical protein
MRIGSLIMLVLFTMSSVMVQGQKKKRKTKTKIRVPIEVEKAFQTQYPNTVASWSQAYRGLDNDELIYEAKFKINKKANLAVYDKSGNLKVLQESITIMELPKNAIDYLKRRYPYGTTKDATKVTSENKRVSYRVVVTKEEKFYDIVFDYKGEFFDIIERG